ncbi:hypothetical protein PV328_009806 [Microctonus aethiopoides]|uniref:ADAMTS cysteine-rich domain-containing protein n=1 Tax=Microctonus aethiopoides TaxID=144406 RepID=A0AA39F126_9HYME|nr:hypothetical protein PV328_009806 [Microctonus aethiopoides]
MSEKYEYEMKNNQQTNESVIFYPNNFGRFKRSPTLKTLTLKVKINGKSKIIKLTATNQILANDYLPVWISSNKQNEVYQKLHNVKLEDVGKFTLYHDYYTKSAIVYFHKRKELDGIINIRYKIQGLPIEKLDEEHIIQKSKYFDFLKKKNVFQYLRRSNQCKTGIELCKNHREKIYPELLVAISHDMFQAIEKTSRFPRGVKTISHVLIVYNIVDMMFKYVKSADISLNIAGIVIEGSENEWGFMKKSHSYIEANKINDDIDEYFRTREKYFPRHSFDYVAYNTRENIVTSTKISILGISTSSGYEPIFYPHEYPYRYNFAVKDSESYEHYTTIAHELAHVFNAGHDKIMNWFFIHPCERSVMAAVDCSSSYCLKWSDKTENDFKKFFNSPAHCILRNKPQSLIPSWQKQLRLTKLQQCVCYGYKSHYEVDKEYFIKDMCGRNIMCKNDQDQVITNLPYPMNGTPCGKNKICWDEKCISPI